MPQAKKISTVNTMQQIVNGRVHKNSSASGSKTAATTEETMEGAITMKNKPMPTKAFAIIFG